MKTKTILSAMADPALFAETFKRRGLLRTDSFASWKVFLRALFGLGFADEAQRGLFKKHTGRSDVPGHQFNEAFVICGRRSGKSLIAALIAVFLACFKNYDDVLAPGERGTVMILGSDRRQCQVILGYVEAFLSAPVLAPLVRAKLKESIELTNRITIEIHTSNFRAVRGFSIVAAICDELAFWRDEASANPDVQVLNALRPAMATVPGALLLGISSPYSKRGALYEAYRANFGRSDSPVLVWQSDSRSMNPTLPRAVVAAAYLRDAASARAEFGGLWREDLADFISIETVEACVVAGRVELPPVLGNHYLGFVDSSGGRSDSMCLGIAHAEGDKTVLDLLLEVEPPFEPSTVVEEFASTLRRYRISEAIGDQYAAQWVVEQFSKAGIVYRPAEQTRSELYLEALPALTSRQIELLANRRMVNQFVGLERRAGRSGKDSIDHSPGGHDDLCNAAAGAVVIVMRSLQRQGLTGLWELQARELKEKANAESLGESPEQNFQRQANEQMSAAVASVAPEFGVFGGPKQEIVATRKVQAESIPQTPACPKCGNANLTRAAVQGFSGDMEERCGNCGFTQIVPRPVSRSRE